LSQEGKCLKLGLEDSIRNFFEFYDEFVENKTKLESHVFEHFYEMRFQIDQQREELKKKIDDIALALIDETKKYEKIYLNDLKDKFSSFDENQSLDSELHEIEETFRNPSLIFETIEEMQQKQAESLNEIQFKLYEMSLVKNHLKSKNYFMPNLSSFNLNETYLFGSIRLNQYTNMSLFKSQILKDGHQYLELIELCEFCPYDEWSLLYRGTRDGFGSDDFHSKCDGHSNTLTLLKAKGSGYIFGGFTKVRLDSSSKYKSDPNAFLFSLINKDNNPVKMKIDPNRHQYAIYCDSSYGPTFGGSHDICIGNHSNTKMKSYSNLGLTYSHRQYAFDTNEAMTFLAGSYEFQLDEIEVFREQYPSNSFLIKFQ
jgi:hypothetical protein